mmetsp:Transcript_18795/g.40722  ORF Transcript_18795/g.40722 Transcript_18795/m.40722 type:complete len:254 (-) Transcript_18795:64-825(-)
MTDLKKIKAKIMESKSTQRKAGDGIESQMFSVLKLKYGVTVQAYHGGTMTGKDIQKVMENASAIFALFANILKVNKKEGFLLLDEDIDALCNQFSNLCVLWDGAFSYASILDPTDNDIKQYKRFVTAAVKSHIAAGLSVTPKVHLMWKHVALQMELPGGLGWKREDWVEHMHQITCRVRDQFRTTKDKEVRAVAMARAHQQYTEPAVDMWISEVDRDASTGPRAGYITKVAERKKRREETRAAVLAHWEGENI